MNPQWKEKLIDGRQLMLLLVLGRMFSMMTYSPGKEAVPGSVTLAARSWGVDLGAAQPASQAFWTRCSVAGGLAQALFGAVSAV